MTDKTEVSITSPLSGASRVERSDPRDDGDKKARSPGRARNKPLKPLRRELPDHGCTCGDYARVLFQCCTRGCGYGQMYPAFPAPSSCEGRRSSTRANDALRECTGVPLRAQALLLRHARAKAPTGPRKARPDDRLRASSRYSVFERSGYRLRVKKTRQNKRLEPRF